jgi:phosphate transport system permease protein
MNNSSKQRMIIQKIGFTGLTLLTSVTVIVIVLIVFYIVSEGAGAISFEFIFSVPYDGMRSGGIWPAIVGTFYLTLGTAILAVPLGIGAAIFLSEYPPKPDLWFGTGWYS